MAFADNTTGGRVILEGYMPLTITLTDTCEVGDLIGFDAVDSNKWERADADGKVYAELIAAERCEKSGDTVKCYRYALIGGITTADGDIVYLSDTAGEYIASPGGSWSQAVGKSVSTTTMMVNPSAMPISVYDGTGVGFGAFIRSEVESGRTTAGRCGGAEIVSKVISGATLGGNVIGLYVFVQWQDAECGYAAASDDGSTMVRLEDGCSTDCHPYAFITFVPGAVGPNYFFHLANNAPSSGSYDLTGTAKTGANHGWLTVMCSDAVVRYINMWGA